MTVIIAYLPVAREFRTPTDTPTDTPTIEKSAWQSIKDGSPVQVCPRPHMSENFTVALSWGLSPHQMKQLSEMKAVHQLG